METTIKHFDILDCVNKYKSMGIREDIAQYTARQIDEAINLAVEAIRHDVDSKDHVTKKDLKITQTALQADTKALEIRLIKWMAGTVVLLFSALAGILGILHSEITNVQNQMTSLNARMDVLIQKSDKR